MAEGYKGTVSVRGVVHFNRPVAQGHRFPFAVRSFPLDKQYSIDVSEAADIVKAWREANPEHPIIGRFTVDFY